MPFLTNVGRAAEATLESHPQNTIKMFLDLMGRKYDDAIVQKLKAMMPFKVMKTSDGTPAVQVCEDFPLL